MEQQSQEKVGQLQQNLTIVEAERQALQDAVVSCAQCFKHTHTHTPTGLVVITVAPFDFCATTSFPACDRLI